MPNKMRVEIEGLQDLVQALEDAGANVKEVLQGAVLAAGEIVLQAAILAAPGSEIYAKLDEDESSDQKIVVNVGPDDQHWYYQFAETGATAHEISAAGALAFEGSEGLVITKSVSHPGMVAKPFLRPALTSTKDEAVEEVGSHIKGALE